MSQFRPVRWCVYECIYLCVFMCVRIVCVCIYGVHMKIRICMCLCMCVRGNVVGLFAHEQAYTCVGMNAFMYMWFLLSGHVCMCVCMSICTCVCS